MVERLRQRHHECRRRYDIGNLLPGIYRVEFHDLAQRFAAAYYDNAGSLETADDVVVSAGSNAMVSAVLHSGSRISGVVRNGSSNPLANIDVRLYRNSGGVWRWFRSVTTDGNGAYVVSLTQTGTYRVGFYDRSGVYAPQFYNQVQDVESAADIAITKNSDVSNIDGTLTTAGAISGHVSAAGGAGLAGIQVMAYRVQGNGYEWIGQINTDATGNYRVGGLGSDSYRLYFFDPSGAYAYAYYGDAATLAGASDVAVTAGATTADVDIVLAQPASPAAEASSPGGGVSTDVRSGEVTIVLAQGHPSPITITRTVTCEGGATLSNVKLVVRVGGPEQLYTMVESSLGSNRFSATIQAAILTGNATLFVRYQCDGTGHKARIGQVRFFKPLGVITDGDTGLPLAGATVLLYQVPGSRTAHRADRCGSKHMPVEPLEKGGYSLEPTSSGSGYNRAVRPAQSRRQPANNQRSRTVWLGYHRRMLVHCGGEAGLPATA